MQSLGTIERGVMFTEKPILCGKDRWGYQSAELSANADCGETFPVGSKTKRFATPNYPGNYFIQQTCTWTINARPGYVIKLHFHPGFSLEYGANCQYDHLKIDEVHPNGFRIQLGRWCGTKPPDITSHTSKLVLVFWSGNRRVSSGFSASWEEIGCPRNYVIYPEGNKCYRKYDEMKSWEEANETCQGEDAHLVVIHDKGTDHFIKDNILGGKTYWIGLRHVGYYHYQWVDGKEMTTHSQLRNNSHHQWMDGEEMIYTVWLPNQPGSVLQKCVLYELQDGVFGWNDRMCSNKSPYICENDAITCRIMDICKESFQATLSTSDRTDWCFAAKDVIDCAAPLAESCNDRTVLRGLDWFKGQYLSQCDTDWHRLTVGGNQYYVSMKYVTRWEAPNSCHDFNMTELFIESNEEFFQLQDAISDKTELDNETFWIMVEKRSEYTWGKEGTISDDAWMTVGGKVVEPADCVGCCLQLSRRWWQEKDAVVNSTDDRHYLTTRHCTNHTAGFICVKACPDKYVYYPEANKCFLFVKAADGWGKMITACEDLNASMVVIHDKETDDFIKDNVALDFPYWIGLRRKTEYVWFNDDKLIYDGWQTPYRKNPYRCVASNYSGWFSASCFDDLAGVCEKAGKYDLWERLVNGSNEYYLSKRKAKQNYVHTTCATHGMTELFIQSNEEYSEVKELLTSRYDFFITLHNQDSVWIKTKQTPANASDMESEEIRMFWWRDGSEINSSLWDTGSKFVDEECTNATHPPCCVRFKIDVGLYRKVQESCTDKEYYYICVKETGMWSYWTAGNATETETTAPTTKNIQIPELKKEINESLLQLKNMTSSNDPKTNNLCPCRCQSGINMRPSPTELRNILQKIENELKVDKTSLSSTKNKKESAKDERPVSKTMGTVAMAICAVSLAVIVALDLVRVVVHFKLWGMIRRHFERFSKDNTVFPK